MNWKYKALLELAFSNMPLGERTGHFLQRHVTKTLPTSDTGCLTIVSIAKDHIAAVRKHSTHSLGEATFYEFGAGRDLMVPLAFYAFGVNRQILVDIRRLLRMDLVNDTITKFQRMALTLGLSRVPDKHLEPQRDGYAQLKAYYGIDYRAPCDARQTGIEPRSIDCITSTNTLEHIPRSDIAPILRECRRIVRDDGVISCRIDYQDHYSYFDRSISGYNFLQYSDRAWALFNPGLHYQNRLRHRDYLELLGTSAFDVLEQQRNDGTPGDLEILMQMALDEQFRGVAPAELAVRDARIVLRKRSDQSS